MRVKKFTILDTGDKKKSYVRISNLFEEWEREREWERVIENKDINNICNLSSTLAYI